MRGFALVGSPTVQHGFSASPPAGGTATGVGVSHPVRIPPPGPHAADTPPAASSLSPLASSLDSTENGRGPRKSLGSGGCVGSAGKKVVPLALRAERAVSRVRWDPQFEEYHHDISVAWTREDRDSTRASGGSSWSERIKRVPCETNFIQFTKDGNPPYHLMTEIRLHTRVIWSATWNSDRVAVVDAQLGAGTSRPCSIGVGAEKDSGPLSTDTDEEVEEVDGSAAEIAQAMPQELWAMVLSALVEARDFQVQDLCALSCVCSTLHDLALDPKVWEVAHARVFGHTNEPEDGVCTPPHGSGYSGVAVTSARWRVLKSETQMQPWRLRPDWHSISAASSASSGSACVGPVGSGMVIAHGLSGANGTSLVSSKKWTCITRDASGGERSRRLDSDDGGWHHAAVRAIFYDGGGLVASADASCVRLWSVERRKRICTLKSKTGKDELHPGGVSSIAIDGSLLLSGGGDGCLHLFDLEDLAPLTSLRGHGAPISDGLLLSDHGEPRGRCVSSSVDGAVKLWDASGAAIADLQPVMPPDRPPHPVPLALQHPRARAPRLFCGRGACLVRMDLETETPTGNVPMLNPHCPVLHVAAGASDPTTLGSSPSGADATAPGNVGAHLVASCCHNTNSVHLWDARLLPSDTVAEAAFDGLSGALRRCLVASVTLPQGAACARQLHLDGSRLLASADTDAHATAFSRGAQSAVLFDVRACSGRGTGALVWEQPVRGDISCFQCRGDRVLVGTGTGSVYLWSFAHGPGAGTDVLLDRQQDSPERSERKEKREKFRAALKVRGRYPKTQGFSNSKGFRSSR